MTLIAITLTFASGAMDVISFTRMGAVFTSVMTGNIVLWGLAVARGSLSLAGHTVVSIAGYIVGVAGASLIAAGKAAGQAAGKTTGKAAGQGAGQAAGKTTGKAAGQADSGASDSPGEARAGVLPSHVSLALLAELILLAGFTVGWEVSGANPAGWVQFCLLAVAAAAMGVQSSAVRHMGLAEVSTTYLTGTLTGLVSSLVSPGQDTPQGLRRFGVLIGLAAGAGLSGLLIATAAAGVPVLPVAALVTTLVLASAPLPWEVPWRRPVRLPWRRPHVRRTR